MRTRTINRSGGGATSLRCAVSSLAVCDTGHGTRERRKPTSARAALERILRAQVEFSSPDVSCADWEASYPEFVDWTEAALNRATLMRVAALLLEG